MSAHLPLAGKTGVIFGVANKRSIAWAIAQAWHKAGAKLIFNYQGERLKDNVEELAGTFGADTPILPCDVGSDEQIDALLRRGQKADRPRSTCCCTASPSPRARRLTGEFVADQPPGFFHRARHQRLLAGRADPRRAALHGEERRQHRRDVLPRRGARRAAVTTSWAWPRRRSRRRCAISPTISARRKSASTRSAPAR